MLFDKPEIFNDTSVGDEPDKVTGVVVFPPFSSSSNKVVVVGVGEVKVCEVPYTNRTCDTVLKFGSIEPFKTAAVEVIDVAATVETVGVLGFSNKVKLRISPR